MNATMSDRAVTRNPSAAPSQLRVMMLLGGLGIGGAETQAIALAAGLQRDGHTVELVALADGALRPMAESLGLTLHVMPRVAGLALTAIPALTRRLSASQPQVVYAFLEVQWLLALAAVSRLPRARRPRVVLGLRTSDYDARPTQLKARVVRTLAKYSSPRADLLIANSRAGLDSYRLVVPDAPHGVVVPNGIDVTRFVPSAPSREHWRRTWSIPTDAAVVGHVGRLDPVKDHELLLRAFAVACVRDLPCHLVCVGHGDPERVDSLERIAESLGIASRVHFVGGQADASTIYPAFDILALTSRREGFPNVVAEAMSCGVPAIVTNCGASADIVSGLGEVAPVGDADAFAMGLSRLLVRRSSALAQDNRTHIVSNFSLGAAASRTAAALQSLFQVNTV
ncbi:glycosyltransferase [Gemmatimonas groenlandica]|uniref:Glycosyltransferase n=1 Tax=Gemmatimonas groenlandica TaxID=2732249 RepID=A0A6M4IM75_9BACT|nr:glycosyltransferase [Gemmatimonas groenlandica]QJR34122.1 glycosyltransferase [Gemmatimonas groenlandica]